MPKIKGKQIHDASITQKQLSITNDSILNGTDVPNVNFVKSAVAEVNYATSNIDMPCLVATAGDLAVTKSVIEFPTSNIQVKLNGLTINVGEGKDCYFSPDNGTTIRKNGAAEKGDFLYWNDASFDLEITDEIDFIYIVSSPTIELEAGTEVTVDPEDTDVSLTYTGDPGTQMDVVIDGVTFVVGNVAGIFTWDLGGSGERGLSEAGDFIIQEVNGEDYTIWFDGFGSLLYTVSVGNWTPLTFQIGTGFDFNVKDVANVDTNKYFFVGAFNEINGTTADAAVLLNNDGSVNDEFNPAVGFSANSYMWSLAFHNNQYLIGGVFTSFNGVNRTNLIRVNRDGTVDETFDTGTGFDALVMNIIVDNDGKYLIGGMFETFNGTTVNRIVRLNTDGTLDTTFTMGTGFNNYVTTILPDSNGKYLVGGQFTTYNGVGSSKIIRLNSDGTHDTSFAIGTGFDTEVSIAIQDSDGKYVIGGSFVNYNGATANVRVIRLEQNGTVDGTFASPSCNSSVADILEDSYGRYVMVGAFTNYGGTIVRGIAALYKNGDLDTAFLSGSGFDSNWPAKIIQDSSRKYMVVGDFPDYNDIPSKKAVRLNTNGLSNTYN